VTTRLSSLASLVIGATSIGDATVNGVSFDSRTTRPGELFLAFNGDHLDGHGFARSAVERGASAIVVERQVDLLVPQLVVPSVPEAAGTLSAAVYGFPSQRLVVVGVTGTNGKTTTCQLLRACLSTDGHRAAQIGTTGVFLDDNLLEGAGLSTPQAPDLQRLFERVHSMGADRVAIEVTSHGLHRHRVDGTHFKIGIFLNLSPEHLDYHGSMEEYFEAKSRMFEPLRCEHALICVDDEWGRRLAATCSIPTTTFGRNSDADVRIEVESLGLRGIRTHLTDARGTTDIGSGLIGDVNAYNVAAAYLAARTLGVSRTDAVRTIGACAPPPGRFELITTNEPFHVVADYAHTPDALSSLIETARRIATGRTLLVLGARGQRFVEKRPEMARRAVGADHVWFTTDSPGDEDPQGILDAMREGVQAHDLTRVNVELDRGAAIRRAVEQLRAGDVLLMTGRGPESTQRFAERTVILDDRVVAKLALDARSPVGSKDVAADTVSVVISARDAEGTLADALASVFAQSLHVDEVVVVDDGSVDTTADVARSFGPSVSVIRQSPLGPAAARNIGATRSSGRWIAFLDATSTWHPAKLTLQLRALREFKAVLCTSDWGEPDGDDGASNVTDVSATRVLRDASTLRHCPTSTFVVRRDVFGRCGGFDANLEGGNDVDAWSRMARWGDVVKVDGPLVRRDA